MRRHWIGLAIAAGLLGAAQARADVAFTAEVDRTRISQDESVSLKLSIRMEGAQGTIEGLRFNAPDFDEINEYSGVFVESFYENGRFGVRHNRTVTKVLRPKKTGTLQITGIELQAGGKTYRAESVTVEVEAGGQGTPAPRGYGGGGVGLRGAGKRTPGQGFFVRAELDKSKAYKGEQLIVSYYLYHRVRIFNLSVDKYPELKGFLREDLEMPVLGQRYTTEQVMLDGVPYERSLLVRYAAYPLREGKQSIDSLSLKANYYGVAQRSGDEDDPFFGFFQQMAPRVGSSRSEPLQIEILPLPEAGRPAGFSGIVGDFSVMAAVDKYEVKAGEPVTLTIKAEGRGNLASLAQPKTDWPSGLELYESKGRSKNGKSGVGEKVFELLLIPRQPGTVKIPQIEFSFFDPAKATYVTRATESFDIQVKPGDPSQAHVVSGQPPAAAGTQATAPAPADEGFDPSIAIQGAAETLARLGRRVAPVAGGLLVLFGLFFVGRRAVAYWRARASTYEAERDRKLAQVASVASRSDAPWNDVLRSYETLASVVFDAIDRQHPVGARSWSREDLGRMLVDEHKLSAEQWGRLARILEHAETVRFAIGAGGATEETARRDLTRWLNETRVVLEELRTG